MLRRSSSRSSRVSSSAPSAYAPTRWISSAIWLQPDSLHLVLVLGEPLIRAIVELGRARTLVHRDFLGVNLFSRCFCGGVRFRYAGGLEERSQLFVLGKIVGDLPAQPRRDVRLSH